MKVGRSAELTKAVVIGASGAMSNITATTLWMHRVHTHHSYNPPKALELAARTIIWGSGVKPRIWAAVHRDHHDYADMPGDPHSPVMQGKFGVAKILFKNAFLYRNTASTKKDEDLPEDLQPDNLDKKIFDRTKTGVAASLASHVVMNKLVGNRARMGLLSFAIEKVGYVAGGNFVNAIGHGGQHPWRATLGAEIQPHEDGSYGADSVTVGAFTLGEGMQRAHHAHPENYFFGNRESLSIPRQFARDSAGALIGQMIDHGLAETSHKSTVV